MGSETAQFRATMTHRTSTEDCSTVRCPNGATVGPNKTAEDHSLRAVGCETTTTNYFYGSDHQSGCQGFFIDFPDVSKASSECWRSLGATNGIQQGAQGTLMGLEMPRSSSSSILAQTQEVLLCPCILRRTKHHHKKRRAHQSKH
jgi:hypothetical protein